MHKYGKKYNSVIELVSKNKLYPVLEALELVKKISAITTKFDSTIEVVFNLSISPSLVHKVKGVIVLPKGIGRVQKILVLTNTKRDDLKKYDVDFIGGNDLIERIRDQNWFGFDVIVATPEIMPELGKIAKILVPKKLMPDPKIGTVTNNVVEVIKEIKKGRLIYKADKGGNVHLVLGKSSFELLDLKKNYDVIYDCIHKLKSLFSKRENVYIKNVVISSTMGPGIKVIV